MSYIVSIILAILFSVLSCTVTGSILMAIYLKKVTECLDAAHKEFEKIKEKNSR